MRRGETATFVFRPEYAYGLEGKPAACGGLVDVPGGASVVYEVELISLEAPKREAWEMSLDERLDEVSSQTSRSAALLHPACPLLARPAMALLVLGLLLK